MGKESVSRRKTKVTGENGADDRRRFINEGHNGDIERQ